MKLIEGMSVSIEKIASLAYLELSEGEKAAFQKQIDDILHYVNQLEKVPMSPEESQAMGAYHVLTAFHKQFKWTTDESLRNDNESLETQKLNLSNAEALQNAPSSSGLPGELLFEVPSIIERE